MLGIQDHILSSALTAKASLGSTATTLGSRTFQQHQPPLRLVQVITQLSRPLTTALFILHTALVAPHTTSPLVSFAEMAVLESAAWNLRVRWASLRRGVRELRGGMDSLEALYECEKLEIRVAKRAPRPPYVRRELVGDGGRVTRGMEIEFRSVSLRPRRGPFADSTSLAGTSPFATRLRPCQRSTTFRSGSYQASSSLLLVTMVRARLVSSLCYRCRSVSFLADAR